ncbi:hypothetical protein G9C85_16440 [Halorubellus sp. JP-L1]|uniref:hypothetical protein n=1 Tax=Halorubellus sp. JP-L1 TaxID=2715753 RepID=UPI00140759A8|nr:hypothetical protein [Halorubellus sp. JP-L1]NHN43207.1 hypothetical protein [Halorubellus sp. JP-L1]
MAVALESRWARRYVAIAVAALVAAHAAALFEFPDRTVVVLVLYGFVLHVVFGKAYSLVPTYFDRELAVPRAMVVQLPLTAGGVLGLALESLPGVPSIVERAGAVAWALGVLAFVGALAWTVRGNPTGAETATGEGKSHLAGLDRVANAFVPVVGVYLLAGTYATLVVAGVAPAVAVDVLPVFDRYPPRATHLLAAGTATLLVFALGARLFPRFLVVDPPRRALALALGTGALAPVVLAAGVPADDLLPVGAVLQTTAVGTYAVAFAAMYWRSERSRVAFDGVLVGALAGVAVVAIGAHFAFVDVTGGLVRAHQRLALLGFLGLTVVGVTLQFYPPTVGRWPYCSNRTARVAIGALAVGVALQAIGAIESTPALATAGAGLGLAGSLVYAYVLAGAFATR